MALSQTSAVGALTLPVPAGVENAKFDDPALEAILDFLAWSLNNDLSAKLAKLVATSDTAVPSGDTYSFDPWAPRGHKVHRPAPSLFLWWDGNSTPWQPTQLQRGTIRQLKALFIFDERADLAETVRRSGMFAAVDKCFAKASDRGYHPSYSYNSKPVGTPVENSVGELNSWDWKYLGGQGVQRIGIDDPNRANVGHRKAGRHYPGFAALFELRELVLPTQPQDPDDVTTDAPFTLTHDGVAVLDHTLEPPDGDEAQP